MMNLVTYIPLASSLIILFILGYVIGQRKKQDVNRAFVLLFFDLFALTFLDFFLRVYSANPGATEVIMKCTGVCTAFNGLLVLNFVYAMAGKKRGIVFVVWCLAALAGAVFSTLPGEIIGKTIALHDSPNHAWFIPSRAFLLLFCTAIIAPEMHAFLLGVRTYRHSTDINLRRNLAFLFAGTVAAGFFYTIVTVPLPLIFGWYVGAQFATFAFVIFALVLFRAISKHKFLSYDVEQVQRVSERLFSDMRDAVIVLDQRGDAIQINAAARTFMSMSDGAVVNRKLLEQMIPRYRFEDTFRDIRTTLKSVSGDRTVMVSQSNIGEKDASMGRICVIRDITAENKAQQELARTTHIESLGILAGGIAHDFNNLLTGILSAFSLFKMRYGQDKTIVDLADQGVKASQQAAKLTRQLLTFAKGGEPMLESVNMREIVEESVGFVLRGSSCTYGVDMPDETNRISADRGQISQVFHNLSINALQAMSAGGTITVSGKKCTVSPSSGLPLVPGEYVEIVFADTGSGIPPETLGRIFEPYFTTKSKGSGLGLATTFSIVKRHNGFITVSSDVGKGTSFHVYLPYVKTSAAAPPAVGDNSGARERVQGGTIMVVDDDPIVRSSVEKILSWMGYSTESAADAEEALRIFDDAHADRREIICCIVDLTMPGGMNGRDLGRRLMAKNPGIPVIIASGYHDDPVVARYREYGFSGALSKPFEIETMQKLLNAVIGEAASLSRPTA